MSTTPEFHLIGSHPGHPLEAEWRRETCFELLRQAGPLIPEAAAEGGVWTISLQGAARSSMATDPNFRLQGSVAAVPWVLISQQPQDLSGWCTTSAGVVCPSCRARVQPDGASA